MATWDEYLQKSRGMYDPTYNEKVATEQNATNTIIQGLNSQKGNINTNYDNQVTDINNATTGSQNQFSNNMLGRGLGRSTIVTTGLAGISNEGARRVDRTNTARSQDLSGVDTQITQANTSLASKLAGMKSDYETGVLNLAQQLKQYDDEQAYKQQQLELQKQQQAAEEAYRNQQLQLQQQSEARQYQQYKDSLVASKLKSEQDAKDKSDAQTLKDYDKYLDIGLGMRNSMVNDVDDEGYASKTKSRQYDDKTIADWVNGLDLSDQYKVKLLNALNISNLAPQPSPYNNNSADAWRAMRG